jgi:hypothetical protein
MSALVLPSPVHGLGVFAGSDFHERQLVEICRVVPLRRVPDHTGLWEHQLAWTDECDAIASGGALFYNHSDTPNVRMIRHLEENVIKVVAIREIRYGEEMFIQYACKPWW